MAYKKRSKKKKVTRRRSKIGGIGKGLNIQTALTIVAGAIAGRYLVKAVNVPNVKDNVKNAVVLAAGLFLPKFIKGPMGAALGDGMIAAGGIGLASELIPKIAGVDDSLSFPMMVSGTGDGDLSLIAGDDVMSGDLSLIAGMDQDDMY